MCDRDFIKDCLVQILGAEAADEIIEYILTIENEDDYDEFMENIVNKSNPDHITAYEALKVNLLGCTKTPSNSIVKKPTSGINNKPTKNVGKANKSSENKQKKPQQQTKSNNNSISQKPTTQNSNGASASSSSNNREGARKGKKLKFVNFYGQDLKPGLLKGRHPCNCEARKHDLINNCIKCGRIVCEQEGSGPCFFCDNMVGTNDEMELLTANSKESDKFYNYLMERSRSKEWKKAIEARDRLLLSDSLGNAKNMVYDDQCDYFKLDSTGTVIEVEDRSKNDKAKFDFYTRSRFPRNEMRVSLNLATRTATLEEKDKIKNKDKFLSDIHKLLEIHSKQFPKYFANKENLKKEADELMKELIDREKELRKNEKETGMKNKDQGKSSGFSAVDTFRSANEQLQETVDSGMCLSMHQPYASLLVAGIKKHEGRTWSTEHRGRLWIAAAAKQPSDDEILACEKMYRNYYGDSSIKFPRTYPVSCLLGCVHVENCLPQSEYRKLYPNGESDSPFVLICRNPVILPIFYPMSGQHKIFPLTRELHRRAKAGLLTATWVE